MRRGCLRASPRGRACRALRLPRASRRSRDRGQALGEVGGTLEQLRVALRARLAQSSQLAPGAESFDADLVRAVLPVVDHRLGDDRDPAADGGHDREPFVVHPGGGERRRTLHESTRHHRGGTRDQVALQQLVERGIRLEPAAHRGVDAECREQRGVRGPRRSASTSRASAATSSAPGRRSNAARRTRDAIRVPDVVLVGQRDDVAGCREQRLREVRRDAERHGIAEHDERRRRGTSSLAVRRAARSASSTVPSADASSERTISSTGRVCSRMLSSCAPRNRAPLRVPSATETS